MCWVRQEVRWHCIKTTGEKRQLQVKVSVKIQNEMDCTGVVLNGFNCSQSGPLDYRELCQI